MKEETTSPKQRKEKRRDKNSSSSGEPGGSVYPVRRLASDWRRTAARPTGRAVLFWYLRRAATVTSGEVPPKFTVPNTCRAPTAHFLSVLLSEWFHDSQCFCPWPNQLMSTCLPHALQHPPTVRARSASCSPTAPPARHSTSS